MAAVQNEMKKQNVSIKSFKSIKSTTETEPKVILYIVVKNKNYINRQQQTQNA